MISKTFDDMQYRYTYDKRGNLNSEEINGIKSKTFKFDATDHLVEGNNLETGEKSQYTYNGLNVRIGLHQTIKNPNVSYKK